MELARWNPFRELEDMQGRLNRLFGEAPFARTGELMQVSSRARWP